MSYTFKASDVWDFASAIHADVKQKGEELYFTYCPRCHGGGKDKETFSINLTSGAFSCFRASCDYHGHFVELARDYNYQLDFGEPKTYRSLPQRPIVSSPPAVDFLLKRGISQEVTERYRITVRKDNPNIAVFPFYDENNVLQFVKYRQINFSGKGNKEWCEKDTRPILFGMDRCVDFERVVITEGQIDSLSVIESGIQNAVSVPTGALGFTWLPFCFEWLSKFKEVVIFGDCEKGKITLLETLQSRLPQKVKAVRVCDYLGEKDANDILRKYGKSAVIKAVENAEVPQLSNVRSLSKVKAVDLNKLPKVYTGIDEIDKITNGLALGQLIVITGKRGKGKSTFMSQIIAEALEQQQTVLAYSGELADFHFKRWLDLQLAGDKYVDAERNSYGVLEYSLSQDVLDKINTWYADRAYIYDNSYIPAEGELETLPETIEKAIKQLNVSVVCIDNLMTAMEYDGDNLYNAQSSFATKLKSIANKYNVLVILVAHRRKNSGEELNDDVSGSADVTNRADIIMAYEASPDGEPRGKLTISKNRLTGRLAVGDNAIYLDYSPSCKRITGEYGKGKHYGWEYVQAQQDELPDIY